MSSSVPEGDWTPGFFTPLYARMYQGPLNQKEATEEEVAFLRTLFEGVRGPVLDIGCGFGRHAVPLRRAGVRVVGLDRFAHLIAEQPARGREAVCADMRRLPWADAAFEGAYCLFNTFGYFSDAENRATLTEWARVLAPGARLVLQAPNRPAMALIARDHAPVQMVAENGSMIETYDYGAEERALIGRGVWQVGGEAQNWEFRLRMYTAGELAKALAKAGFVVDDTVADYAGTEFRPRSSPQMVVTATRSRTA